MVTETGKKGGAYGKVVSRGTQRQISLRNSDLCYKQQIHRITHI